MNGHRQRAIFLDRDGTVIHDAGYPSDPCDVEPMPGAADALCLLHEAGFLLVLVSNQSGIGRGYITPEEAAAVHEEVIRQFEQEGVTFDGSYYCPHAPTAECTCRKPAPGMLLEAARDLNIDLARSVMVGDKESDIEAARRAGCAAVLFSPSQARSTTNSADAIAADWSDVVHFVQQVQP